MLLCGGARYKWGLPWDCDSVLVPGRRGLFEGRGQLAVHTRGQWAESVDEVYR